MSKPLITATIIYESSTSPYGVHMKRKWFLVSLAVILIATTSIFSWWRSRPTAVERFYEPTPDEAKTTSSAPPAPPRSATHPTR